MSADAVSGATYTSSAAIRNVQATAALAAGTTHVAADDWLAMARNVATMVVVALSLVCYFVPSRTRRWRLPVLVASVLVLGVMQGAFVSIELLYKWLINGTSLATQWSLIVIVAAAVALPLFMNKQYYCMYLCPFGAAQEIVGRLSRFKIRIPVRVVTWLVRLHKYWLFAVVVLLILPISFDVSTVEPFTVFMIRSASLSVILIAGVSLVLSAFTARPWCRFFCPTGELLNILQKSGKKKLL